MFSGNILGMIYVAIISVAILFFILIMNSLIVTRCCTYNRQPQQPLPQPPQENLLPPI